ncbi:maestro heat-like repeat-containing protein family member 1 isoform X1 [Corvus moneduloides]|uniref:maestro heat-like repeat-containing protein family member 1 isoform X1 n=1 Tax=Corvus moneduloides TaxID=1196302 RepID=UPI0013640D74|nr:maestro heat-like repeat-containing protein family member 1 isoform X1 [Corvus moneduloides]
MMESRIRRLAVTLMDATTDKDPEVQEQIHDSLCSLGDADPEEILDACGEYLRQHEKLPYPFRVIVLRSMESVIRKHLGELRKGPAAAAAALASHEMTKSKEPIQEWQEAASDVLVEIGKRFLNKVMEEVLGKFQPGILPHPFVLRTFAELAAANVFGMVPFLNSILGTLLPMLGMARADPAKCGCCYALQRFSESIQEYLANLDQAPDPTIRRDAFSQEIGAAFELLFSAWLQHREAKVRLAVVAALGPMSSLLPEEKLEEQLPKLLPGILGLYKKHPEPFPISKSLCQILESSVAIGSRSLEAQLEPLLGTLLLQICAPADPNVPTSAKNHTELLRCFSVLGCSFPDRLLLFLLPKSESGSERVRVASLLILRQIINSAPSQLEPKKSFIVSSLKFPLQDGSNKVKRALLQLLSSMAPRGYLEQPGAEALLEFLVRQCALPPAAPPGIPEADPEDPTSDSIRSISVSTLLLLSTTVDRMSHVLWPFLLQFLIPAQFGAALTPLCRSLTFLALKNREEQPENAAPPRSERHAHLPSPQALTTRLLVVSSQPFLGNGRGAAALRLLQALRLHPDLENLWNKEIPLLLEHLEGTTEDSLCQQEWEEKLLQFLRESLAAIPEKSWICPLVSEMFRQLRGSDGSQLEKNFLYRSMGTALGACPSKELVRKQLQELLENARYREEAEREGLASCFGICARDHLEETLEKLEEFLKSDVFKKSLGLFSIFKDRSEAEPEKLRSGLVLCYGRVAEAAPPELLRSRLESPILENLLQLGHTKVLGIKVEPKDAALKLSLARSISMIGRALGSSGSGSGNGSGNGSGCRNQPGSIARKAELVMLMVEFLKAEPPEALRTRLRQGALGTCTHLVALEPPLSDPERSELLDTALGSVLGLPPLESARGREEPGAEELFQAALAALRELLRALLRRRLNPLGLQELFAHLGPWLKSPRARERRRAVALASALLEFFLEELHGSALSPFPASASLLALLAPRCSDAAAGVGAAALDCVGAVLRIEQRCQGFSRDHRDELLEALGSLKAGLENADGSVLFRTCSRVASAIGMRIPPEQLLSLLLALFEGLEDPDGNCSRAASVIINSLLRERGGILREKVPELLAVIHSRLEALEPEPLRRGLQQSVLVLALQHPGAVLRCLLGASLPFDSHTCAMWRALGTEPSLTSQILEQLLETLSREIPYKESKSFLLGSGSERVATPLPLAATCALDELMSVPEAAAAVLERFPNLFQSLLLRLGCSVGVQLPKFLQGREKRSQHGSAPRSLQPCSCALETLKAMLERAGNDDVVRDVGSAGGWELMGIPERHHDGIALLAGAMARLCGPRLPRIVRSLIPVLGSVFECQRVTSTAFLAELLNHNVVNDLILLEPLLDALTALEKDSCLLVRILALRGLGNVASGCPEKIRRHGSQLLASMVNGMDDKDDPNNLVALEAMSSLSKLLDHLEERDVQSMLLHVAIRIRPFFDSEQPDLRRSSIVLFGNLSRFGRADSEVFSEQVLNGLVTLLLHLQDPCPDVVKACKFALRMCGPCLGCEGLREMFGNHLREERGLHYGEFINDVCKFLMRSHPALLSRLISTNLFYFKSPWRELRAAAPMFIGFLVLHVDEEQGQQVDLDQLISALKLLLKDPVPAVRIKVAETLGRLVRLL